jgi:DNA polymerase V
MAEGMALGLVSKRLVTDQLVLTVGYDAGNAVEDKTTFW